jgi:hypothetical protein
MLFPKAPRNQRDTTQVSNIESTAAQQSRFLKYTSIPENNLRSPEVPETNEPSFSLDDLDKEIVDLPNNK